MHYNATLCKEALGKNYWHELRSVRVFVSKTMTVIFLERCEGVATENLKRQFINKPKNTFSLFRNLISEMKQTKN